MPSKYWLIVLYSLAVYLHLPAEQEMAVPSASPQITTAELFKSKQNAIALVRAFSNQTNVTQLNTACFIDKHLLLSSAKDIHSADILVIEFSKRFYPAICIGFDPITNIALLQLKAPIAQAQPIVLTQDELPSVGTKIVNINYQQGLNPCALEGLIMGQNYFYGHQMWPTTHLRINLPSDHGESGSPLFDSNGQFVGLITTHLSDLNASAAIPSKALYKIYQDILHAGKVLYGYIGVGTEIISDSSTEEPYVRIQTIAQNSPAAHAGLKINDQILKIGGSSIRSHEDLINAAFLTYPGQNLIVSIQRNKKVLDVTIQVAEHPSRAQSLQKLPTPKHTDLQNLLQQAPQTDQGSSHDAKNHSNRGSTQ